MRGSVKLNRSSSMSSAKAPDSPRSLWNWIYGKDNQRSPPNPQGCLPTTSSTHTTSTEKHHKHRSSPEQVPDGSQSGNPAVATGKELHRGGGERRYDDGARSRPSTTSREKKHTSEQTVDSSTNDRDGVSHSHAAAPKPERRSSRKPPVPLKPENMPAVPGGGAVDSVRRDTEAELHILDRQTLQKFLRLGLERQRDIFTTYSHGLRNAYGTARTKDDILRTINRVSKDYKDQTDRNIDEQNDSATTLINNLQPQFISSAMHYWAILLVEFNNFLSTSMIAAQEADERSLKLTSKFWAVDKRLEDGVGSAYNGAISNILV